MEVRKSIYDYDRSLKDGQFILYVSIILLIFFLIIFLPTIFRNLWPTYYLNHQLYTSLLNKENNLQRLLNLPCDDAALISYRDNSISYSNSLGLAAGNQSSVSSDISSKRSQQDNRNNPTPNNKEELLDLLKRSTVYILVKYKDNKFGSGSGFFISQNEIVTNNHVIQDAVDIRVVNKAIGTPLIAKVLNSSNGNIDDGQPDFAVLKVEANIQNIHPLNISINPAELSSVITVGFPGSVISSDNDEIPNTVFSEGQVSVNQHYRNMELVIHSASISPGSSGGPLVNRCGFVVGVNTGVKQSDEAELVKASQSVEMLKKYLKQNNIQYSSQGNCTLN